MSKRVYIPEYRVFLSFKNGKLHDYKGRPAVEYVISDAGDWKYKSECEHWQNGRRHNDDGYALIHKNAALSIRNGKVDVMTKHYNIRNNTFEHTPITDYQKYIPCFKKTFNMLNNIEPERLGLTHREFVDSSEKGAIKIYYNGIQHSELGPAELRENGTAVYYQYGVKHWEHGPAVDDKLTKSQFYYYYGVLHNDNGEAFIRRKGNLLMTGWMRYGILHKTDAPAFVKEDFESGVTFEAWYQNGVYHRDGNAAVILDSEVHNIHERFYYNEGKLHNLRGASIVSRVSEGKFKRNYYINDVKYSRKQYEKIMRGVRKVCHKLMKPKRVKLSKLIMKNTCKRSTTFCKDIVNKICEYVY